MELEHSFTIPVPPERAWETLLDVERVAPCMPGATVDAVEGEVITGRIKVKVGPVTLTYAGKARFSERDDEARSVTLEASGRETRGTGTATATVRSVLRGEGDQTEVIVHTSLAVTGRPAQFGRGMLTEVGGRLIDIFAANLAAQLAGAPVAGVSSNGSGPGGAAPGPESAPGAATGTGGTAAGGTAGGPRAGTAAAGGVPIDELKLPARATASLRLAGVTTVGELAARDEKSLLALAGIGPQTIGQIRSKLAERGLGLAGPGAQPAPGAPAAPGRQPAAPPPGGSQAAAPAPVPGGQQPTAITPPAAMAQVGGAAPVPAVGPPAGQAALPPRPRPADEEAIDLLNVAGLPVLKRILPAAGVLAALLAIILVLARRRRRGAGRA